MGTVLSFSPRPRKPFFDETNLPEVSLSTHAYGYEALNNSRSVAGEKVCINSHYCGYVALTNSRSVAQKRYACRGAIYEALTNSGSVEHKRYA